MSEEESLPPMEWQLFLESPQWKILASWLEVRLEDIKQALMDPEQTTSIEEVRRKQGQVEAFADLLELPQTFLNEAIEDRERNE